MKATKGELAAKVIEAAAAAGTLAPDADRAQEAAKLAKRCTVAQLDAMLNDPAEGEVRAPAAPAVDVPAWLVTGAKVFLPSVPPGVSDESRDGLPAERAVVLEVRAAEETVAVEVGGERMDVALGDLTADTGQPLPDGLDEATDEALWALAVRWGIYRTAGKAKKAGRDRVLADVRTERGKRKLVGWTWATPEAGPLDGLKSTETPAASAGDPGHLIAPGAGNPLGEAAAAIGSGSLTDDLLATLPAPARLDPAPAVVTEGAPAAATAPRPATTPAVTTLEAPVAVVLLAGFQKGDSTAIAAGTLRPDGTLEVDGVSYPTPGEAHAALGTKGDATWAWNAWRIAGTGEAIRSVKRSRDGELPPVGTVIRKLDREGKVRAECVVEEGGKIGYAGKSYTSLSAAAQAAGTALGLTTKAYNGWAWWGLETRTARPAKAAGAGIAGLEAAVVKATARLEAAKAAHAAAVAARDAAVAARAAEITTERLATEAAPTA